MYRRVASWCSTGLTVGLVGTRYTRSPQEARSGGCTAHESDGHITARALPIAVLAHQAARCACSEGDCMFDELCDLVHVLAQRT